MYIQLDKGHLQFGLVGWDNHCQNTSTVGKDISHGAQSVLLCLPETYAKPAKNRPLYR